jgi:uncharacterized protein YdcH (DUF465 family)
LKHEIETIESKPHVTGDDEIEEHRLKKLKLHIKDQINILLAGSKQVTVH